MTRHTTFRYCLDPTSEQMSALVRHAGAARFAFNQCLRMVKDSLSAPTSASDKVVPWSGFDLINAFNAWKKTDAAGRTFVVDRDRVTEIRVTGLAWRTEVCQQVFEEAAVDCGRALAAWADSRTGKRPGRRVGFPRFKLKSTAVPSFRVRNRHRNGIWQAIRVGEGSARSVTVPGLGVIRVHDDTRPLRRLLAKDRAKVRFATFSYRAGRWWVSLNVEAAELHSAHRHRARPSSDHGGWVGVDRGLSTFLVAASADGRQLERVDDPPRALARGIQRQRRLARSLSRKQKGSRNRNRAAAKLSRHHYRRTNEDSIRENEPVVGLDQPAGDPMEEIPANIAPKREPRLKRPADGKALADTSRVLVKPVRVTREQMSRPNYLLEQTTPEKGGAGD